MEPLLKAIETLKGAPGPNALCDRLAAVTQPRGHPLCAIGSLTGERRRDPRHFALNNCPDAWFEKYRDDDFKVEDPIQRPA